MSVGVAVSVGVAPVPVVPAGEWERPSAISWRVNEG